MSFFLQVPTTNGKRNEIVYNINDFPYRKLFDLPTVRKKITYYNVSCAFDIETTTIESEKNAKGKYLKTPYGFMYHWQACIAGHVVFGRTWQEYQQFLDNLRDTLGLGVSKRLVIYVHNLAYEFQFMHNFIRLDDMFAKDKRKPLKVISDGIEFRCSYFLSNMSLIKFCENSELCKHYKLDGEYDYKKIRTPNTKMTETELAYCFNDVYGLCECIDTMLLQDDIISLPLTSTGFIRREYRTAMNNPINRSNFIKTQLLPKQYELLRSAFRGGNTHASRFYSGKILKNVYSFDKQSSYPASILLDYYPMGKFTDVTLDTQEKLDYYCENYCVVMEVSLYDIVVNECEPVPYIDIAHCKEHKNIINDNGRVLSADFITMALTEIDLDIICRTYDIKGGIQVNYAMYAKRGKLPIELVQKMLDFFYGKTLLKGLPDKVYEYMKSKNKLNATFGMMVTDIAHDMVAFLNGTWGKGKPNLEKALENFYSSRNNFLSYQWGVYVTAQARRQLQLMIDIVRDDLIYTDTDSIKFLNECHIAEFEALNKKLIEDCYNSTPQGFCEKNGKKFFLGVWENEGKYRRFLTLGAKKYCFEKARHLPKEPTKQKATIVKFDKLIHGKISKSAYEFEVTVSGMHKKKGAKQVGTIENFKIGRTYSDVGRTSSYYNEEEPHYITVNGDTFLTASNIGIVDTTYTLGVTFEYWDLIFENVSRETIEESNDIFNNLFCESHSA